jgi:hypothetical protein
MSFIMTERLVLKEGVKRRNRNSVIANGFDEVLFKKKNYPIINPDERIFPTLEVSPLLTISRTSDSEFTCFSQDIAGTRLLFRRASLPTGATRAC